MNRDDLLREIYYKIRGAMDDPARKTPDVELHAAESVLALVIAAEAKHAKLLHERSEDILMMAQAAERLTQWQDKADRLEAGLRKARDQISEWLFNIPTEGKVGDVLTGIDAALAKPADEGS